MSWSVDFLPVVSKLVIVRHSRVPFRTLCVAIAVGLTAGCDPTQFAAFAVRPHSGMNPDTSGDPVTVVARIAIRNGLESVRSDGVDDYDWAACFARETLFLCAK